jgi:hypothetical protein
MTDYDIHSCGYYCNRPACIEAQRNELRDKLFEIRTSERNIQTSDKETPESSQPTEPTIDGWPLWSGLPPIKVQDEREANYKSFAQSARVNGIPEAYTPAKGGLLPEPQPVAYINVEKRELEWAKPTRWQTPTVVKTDNIPLYLVPPKKEWVGLTKEDLETVHQELFSMSGGSFITVAKAIEAKLKEKNT